jgi:site-specific recombinase XerD
MNLSEGIETYVQRKHREGFLFNTGSETLRRFCRETGDLPLDEVSTKHVAAFLDRCKPRRQPGVQSWRVNHSLVRRFFEYWAARNTIPQLLMPPNKPPVRQTFVAHVYTREEIRRLVHAIPKCQSNCACIFDKRTVRFAILLLYATGARVGEITGLRVSDVDAKHGYISITGEVRFGRSRKIPIGRDLRAMLKSYLAFRLRENPINEDLFVARGGQRLTPSTLRDIFQRLRSLAGVRNRNGSGAAPRLHDLRPSFAVHRIGSWIKSGADLNRMLPALAAYMGLRSLTATERYMALTPERFRKELSKLSPQHRRKHWRDNPELMRFLAGL